MAGYGSANNIKHREMEDSFINFTSATSARYTAFTELASTNGNLSTKLWQQKDQIQALQAKLCNLKVAAETQSIDRKTNKTGQPYARCRRQKTQWPTYPTGKRYNNNNYF